MKRPFVSIILAGGKGTRMGATDRHKVCFPVGGTPVILRALETYHLCGARTNVIVVGALAESVMVTVSARFPGAVFAFQAQPRGTGDAARQGARILERMGFEGDVLLVAGDKLIEPCVIRRLLAVHQAKHADVTLATAPRPPGSNTGILLTTGAGRIVGILEEAERQRLVGLAMVSRVLGEENLKGEVGNGMEAKECLTRRGPEAGERKERLLTSSPTGSTGSGWLDQAAVQRLLSGMVSEKNVQALVAELWSGLEATAKLDRAELVRHTSPDERQGLLRVGTLAVPVPAILERFTQMNLSTYVFRAAVLFDALHRLKSSRLNQEEYLTDVFELLAHDAPPARVLGCEMEDPEDIMAFNNPQELLAMEEVDLRKTRPTPAAAHVATGTLAKPSEWNHLLEDPPTAVRRQFRQWYGDEVPWGPLRQVVQSFGERFGTEQPAVVIRSPGRINLLGRHVDHQGGPVNVMAINREIYLVATPRADDWVNLANADPARFPDRKFRLSDVVANLDWEDWQQVVDGPLLRHQLAAARGDWANYVQAALLRLQMQFRDRRLRGLDILVGGDVPMGAGLSSSSALVVATAEAASVLNGLPVTARQLVSLCGEGEWFVGTRGGAADHAAIRLSRRGQVTRVSFFPFKIEDSVPFPADHVLIVCQSGLFAGKSTRARQIFNEKVTAYHLGRVLFKMLRPELAPLIEHLRDLTPDHLRLDRADFCHLLRQLPVRLPRAKVLAGFATMAEADRDRLEKLFQTHAAPAGGYPVREVVLFGLSEMARARRCASLLQQHDATELGRLMTRSHDGDRVSRLTARGRRERLAATVSDRELLIWGRRRGSAEDIADLTGAYGCSLPELDQIVDLAVKLPGVRGAQLAGAGLGGCVMVLAQQEHAARVLTSLANAGIEASPFHPIAGAGPLVLV